MPTFRPVGTVLDLYREQVQSGGVPYAGVGTGLASDDYRQNTTDAYGPTKAAHVHEPAYSAPATPAAPVITNNGMAGAATYSYVLEAISNAGAPSAKSAAGTTATGNATLNQTNNNQVAIPAQAGIKYVKVYRSAAPGGYGLGYIGNGLPGTNVLDTGQKLLFDPDPNPNDQPSFDSWNAAVRGSQAGVTTGQRTMQV